MSCFFKLYNCRFFLFFFHTDVRETVGDRNKREDFDQSVSRRHFLTKSDVRNIRVKVEDRIIKRHEDDATSVTMMVAELQQESFNPILIFKPQGEKDQTHSLPYHLFWQFKPSFSRNSIKSMYPQSCVLIELMAQINTDLV